MWTPAFVVLKKARRVACFSRRWLTLQDVGVCFEARVLTVVMIYRIKILLHQAGVSNEVIEWTINTCGLDLGFCPSPQWSPRSPSICFQTLCSPASSWLPAWKLLWWLASLPSWASTWNSSLTSPLPLPTSFLVSGSLCPPVIPKCSKSALRSKDCVGLC